MGGRCSSAVEAAEVSAVVAFKFCICLGGLGGSSGAGACLACGDSASSSSSLISFASCSLLSKWRAIASSSSRAAMLAAPFDIGSTPSAACRGAICTTEYRSAAPSTASACVCEVLLTPTPAAPPAAPPPPSACPRQAGCIASGSGLGPLRERPADAASTALCCCLCPAAAPGPGHVPASGGRRDASVAEISARTRALAFSPVVARLLSDMSASACVLRLERAALSLLAARPTGPGGAFPLAAVVPHMTASERVATTFFHFCPGGKGLLLRVSSGAL